MGNKQGTQAKKKKISKETFIPSPKPTMQERIEEMIPNITTAYQIQSNPKTSDSELSIICPVCDKKTINEGLDNFLTCRHCHKKFKQRGDEMVLPGNNQKDITDYDLNDQIFTYHDCVESIPEVTDIVLSVCSEKIPSDIRFAGTIDYYNLHHQYILPFFEKKLRIVKENNFITINGIHFKVLSCIPLCGRVTTNTQIHCYKEIKFSKKIQKVKVLACQQTTLTSNDIKKYFAKKDYRVHLERDQTIDINGIKFKTLKCTPGSGYVTEQTEFELKGSSGLNPIKQLCVASFMDKLPIVVDSNQVDAEELEYQINEKIIKPYFESIYRYVKIGESFSIGDVEFTVKNCDPSMGLVNEQTVIYNELFNTKDQYKRLYPKQDGIIEAREDKRDPNFPVTRIVRRRNSSADVFEEEEEIKNDNDRNYATRDRMHENYHSHTHSPKQKKSHKDKSKYQNYEDPPIGQIRRSTTHQNNNPLTMSPQNSNNNENDSNENESPQNRSPDNRQQTSNNQGGGLVLHQQMGPRGREVIINNRVIYIDEILANSSGRNAIIINEEGQNRNSQNSNSGSRHYNVIIIERDGRIRQARVHKKKNKGATPQEINRLPVREIDTNFLKKKNLDSADLLKCSICINDYEHGEKIRTMPCLHYFHKDCLDQWLQKNKICPICKTNVNA